MQNYTVIKTRRKQLKMTQKQLAEKVGVTSAYIQQLENGIKTNPNLQLVSSIAEELNLPLEELFDDETLITLLATDRIINSPGINELDLYAPCNYIETVDSYENPIKVRRNLMQDLSKLIMYTEQIPVDSITVSDLGELELLIIEYFKIKVKVKNLEF